MSIIDEWAERHIAEAQARGELSALPGEGRPLCLDDDSHIPAELRAGYRLLKNAGCLPPELEQRHEALSLAEMLRGIQTDHPDYNALSKRLALLELRLRQAGMDTAFLRGSYGVSLRDRLCKSEE